MLKKILTNVSFRLGDTDSAMKTGLLQKIKGVGIALGYKVSFEFGNFYTIIDNTLYNSFPHDRPFKIENVKEISITQLIRELDLLQQSDFVPREMKVSSNKRQWTKALVLTKNSKGYYYINKNSVEGMPETYDTMWYAKYAIELDETLPIVELSLEEIAKQFSIDIENIKIKDAK